LKGDISGITSTPEFYRYVEPEIGDWVPIRCENGAAATRLGNFSQATAGLRGRYETKYAAPRLGLISHCTPG
jgi:hypothetical protein